MQYCSTEQRKSDTAPEQLLAGWLQLAGWLAGWLADGFGAFLFVHLFL